MQWYSTIAGRQGLASHEQARSATDWRRERRQTVVLKDCQQQETEDKLQFHPCLTLIAQVLLPRWIQFYLHS